MGNLEKIVSRIVSSQSLYAALCIQVYAIYVKCIQEDQTHNDVIVIRNTAFVYNSVIVYMVWIVYIVWSSQRIDDYSVMKHV